MLLNSSILIVDDDEDDRLLLQQAFHHFNFHDITLFDDGYKVLDYLDKEASVLPKLMVSDFNMPTLTGAQLLIKVKENDKLRAIKVYILSTSNLKSQIEDCLKQVAAGYYVKPTSIDGLLEMTKKLINTLN